MSFTSNSALRQLCSFRTKNLDRRGCWGLGNPGCRKGYIRVCVCVCNIYMFLYVSQKIVEVFLRMANHRFSHTIFKNCSKSKEVKTDHSFEECFCPRDALTAVACLHLSHPCISIGGAFWAGIYPTQ